MKKIQENQVGTLLVISAVVVMSVALALTLNGSMLQGNLRGVATYNTYNAYNPTVPYKPIGTPYTFEPVTPEPNPVNDPITRQDLMKLIVNAAKVPFNTTGGPHFSDVSPSSPYFQYVETAVNMGWISGYPDGKFHPLQNVNRAEGAKLFNVALLATKQCSPAYATTPYYKDVLSNDWFYTYVNKLADCKMADIIPSANSWFFPGYLLSNGRAQYMIQNYQKNS